MATFTPAALAAAQTARGRGFDANFEDDRYAGNRGMFDSVDSAPSVKVPAEKSVEGWVLFVTGLTEEHSENDLMDLFSDFGEVKQLRLPLSRITGDPHGFALIMYEDVNSAVEAIDQLDNAECLGTVLHVSWAFDKQ